MCGPTGVGLVFLHATMDAAGGVFVQGRSGFIFRVMGTRALTRVRPIAIEEGNSVKSVLRVRGLSGEI
jgi:hypothetical protein